MVNGDETEKPSILDLLKKEYNRTARRLYNEEPKCALIVRIHLAGIPPKLNLTPKDVKSLLLEIQEEYKGKIEILPLNDNSMRVKRDYYPVRVDPQTLPYEARAAKKPSVYKHNGSWCISLPGEDQPIRVGRIGSGKGELFAIMAGEKRWGTFQSIEHVIRELNLRVKNKRTYYPEHIRELLKEINETLYAGCKKRVVRIGDWPRTVCIKWGNSLWNAVLRMSRGVPTVGFARVKMPAGSKKITSK